MIIFSDYSKEEGSTGVGMLLRLLQRLQQLQQQFPQPQQLQRLPQVTPQSLSLLKPIV